MAVGTLAVLSALGLLAACGSDKPVSSSASSPQSGSSPSSSAATALSGTAWTLTSYSGPGGTMVASSPDGALSFAADGTLSGNTGCNSFGGTYTATDSKLTITLGPMTLRGCVDAAAMAQETAMVQQLPEVASYAIRAGTLTLSGTSGNPLFLYTMAANTLPGTSWQVTGVNNGRGGVESTALTEQLTASFGSDGTFTAFGGCNQLAGTYTTTGTAGLTIGPLRATKKSCGSDIDQLETEYSTALAQVARYDINNGTLTMRDSQGSTQVTAVAH